MNHPETKFKQVQKKKKTHAGRLTQSIKRIRENQRENGPTVDGILVEV